MLLLHEISVLYKGRKTYNIKNLSFVRLYIFVSQLNSTFEEEKIVYFLKLFPFIFCSLFLYKRTNSAPHLCTYTLRTSILISFLKMFKEWRGRFVYTQICELISSFKKREKRRKMIALMKSSFCSVLLTFINLNNRSWLESLMMTLSFMRKFKLKERKKEDD